MPHLVAHDGLWDRVIVVMRRKRDARWSKGERFGMAERERQHGDWMEMRVEEIIRGGLLLRRGRRGLEGDCRQIWHGEWGFVGKKGIVCAGWCHCRDED